MQSEVSRDLTHNLFDIFQPFLRFGHSVFIVPSLFHRKWSNLNNKNEYYRTNLTRAKKIIFLTIQFIFSAYSFYRLPQGYFRQNQLDNFKILHWLWMVCFTVYFIYCTVFYLLFWNWQDKLIKIFEQADVLQCKLEQAGIPLILKRSYRLVAITSSSLLLFAGVIYALLARGLSVFHEPERNAKTVYGFLTLSSSPDRSFEPWQAYILAILGTTVDIYGFSPWFFAEALRLLSGLTMLKVYHHINSSLKKERMCKKDLHKVLEVHMCASKLMRVFNDFMSPITFLGVLQSFLQGCYIVNVFLWNYGDWMAYSQFSILAIRNIVIYHVTAYVSTEAHAISEWLEDISTEPSPFMQKIEGDKNLEDDVSKLMIFTSQVYCKDFIGFKGFDYFTVSNSFVAGIVSLLITYTVIITQFKPNHTG